MTLQKNMTFAEYRDIDALNFSTAKLMVDKTPSHALAVKFDEPTRDWSSPLSVGLAVDCLLFDCDRFDDEFLVTDKFERRSNADKARWQALVDTGKTVLWSAEYEHAKAMATALLAHPTFHLYYTGGKYQPVIVFDWHGVKCKARLDILSRNTVVDLKSAVDASPHGFGAAIARFKYHMQLAWYMKAAESLGLCNASDPASGMWAVIEKAKDPEDLSAVNSDRVAHYHLSAPLLAHGLSLCEQAVLTWRDCVADGSFRGYPASIQSIDMPRWGYGMEVGGNIDAVI